MPIAFTKVALPYGWLGNMSPFPVTHQGKQYRTTEALFQAMRFENAEISEAIRLTKSPMAAKMIAKKNKSLMAVTPISNQDIDNMKICLRLKVKQHPHLKDWLIETGDEEIIEDTSGRATHSPWGAKFQRDGTWKGDNILGRLWMELRDELK